MSKKDTLFTGLMLFSMFFGAGNLLFPPFLGLESGTSLWLAILGFIVTGVGLPIAVLIAISLANGGVQTIGNRVHPIFSTLFTVLVYLCIGPFLAIPRNTNVAFEMGIKPFINTHSSLPLFLFTVVFFILVFLVSLNPAKMAQYMGRFITPILLISIVILCIVGFIQLDQPLQSPAKSYENGAFFKGFIEGYSTMDALASLAFGIVILTTLQDKGVREKRKLTMYTLKTGMIAGIALSAVYIGLGIIGAKMAMNGSFENGTDILSSASTLLLGQGGKVLLGVIFMLACFTTVVGLTSACGQYFSKLIPKGSYKLIVLVVTLIGFVLSNMGLNQILTFSVPFLVMAYPVTIVLITLTFIHPYLKQSKKVYRWGISFTAIASILDGLLASGLQWKALKVITNYLPFSSIGLGWITPAFVGILIGILLSLKNREQQ